MYSDTHVYIYMEDGDNTPPSYIEYRPILMFDVHKYAALYVCRYSCLNIHKRGRKYAPPICIK